MHAGADTRLRLAHARIGAVQLGIPAACVVRALPIPASLGLLPLRGQALRGVIEHDGALLPVVDLARWVEVGKVAPQPGEAARILVLREGGRTIGLLVDALGGLLAVAPHEVQRLHHGDDPDQVFHSAVRQDHGPILSLLEVGRLATLALAWSEGAVDAADAGAAAAPESAPTAQARQYALLETAHGLLGVEPAGLAEVIAMPPLERIGAAGAAYFQWRGRHVALAPAAALAGNAAVAEVTAPLLAVLAHQGLALGLPVSAVRQLGRFDAARAADAGLTAVVYDDAGREIRLLDTAGLFAGCPEAALSRAPSAAAQELPAASAESKAQAGNDCAYIVFEAGGRQAVPIGLVERILPLAAASSATMAVDGDAVPLVDLRPQAAAAGDTNADAAGGHVLLARGAQGLAGYVVSRVESLIPAGTGTRYRLGAGGVDFITTGQGAQQASYRIVELVAPAAT